MRDSVSSDCALAVISFIGQLALFWKDACDKAKGSCKRRRKKRRNRLITSLVMVVDSFLRILRTLCIVFLRLCQFFRKKSTEYRAVRYCNVPLSPATDLRLSLVKRKVMVLDLDETLIHSNHDGNYNSSLALSPPDFIVRVTIDGHLVRFFVHKRPHVDYFLSMICQWFDLIVFTASMQKYGMEVANHLDDSGTKFVARYFRQDCTADINGYTKDLSMVSDDMANIFILDNSPSAYRFNPDNAIPIRSWFSDPMDTALLDLLPFLDALRFTQDVRSVLSRNIHQHLIC